MSRSPAVLRLLPAALLAALLLFAAEPGRAQPVGDAPEAACAPAASVVLRPSAPRPYEFSARSGCGPAGTYPPGETAAPVRPFDAGPDDPWLAFDKVQHLTFSFLWTLGSQYALVNKASLSEGRALPLSAGVSGAVGVAKEYYDWRVGARHDFSHRDLVADAAGILLAVGFILL